jgi:peptidoglycan/xylan/chitin deacetylase (PgdA/CDA1 family)
MALVTDPITVTGYDDELYAYLPLPERAPLRWPGGAAVAFYPVVIVEYFEEEPPPVTVTAGDVYGGLGPGGAMRHPQVSRVGNRDYGHRVGFFRLMSILEELSVRPVIAIDAMSAEAYPAIAAWIAAHDVEVIAHGRSVTQAVSARMKPDKEREYIADAKARIDGALGVPTRGWLGPSGSESGHTLQLLADAGFEYCLDWPNDEQPYYFATTPPLLSLPPLHDLSDNQAIHARGLYNARYGSSLVKAAERLVADGASAGRLLSFTLTTFTSGQPARSSYVKEALRAITAMDGVWVTTPGEVAAAMAAATRQA